MENAIAQQAPALNIFELASKAKVRFDSPKGGLSVEDLWDLQLTSTVPSKANLNDIAKALNKELKASADEVDFVAAASTKANKATELAELKLEIVKHVIAVKIAERDTAAAAAAKAAKRQEIMALIAKKQSDVLGAASIEELTRMLNEL